MNLHKLILTQNACFKAGKTITPKGIMLHSTGANNPYLKRYIGPDDGLLGVNQYNNHWNQDMTGGRNVCVHAFIGKLADGSIATYQTLPWNHRGWHSGGSANDTHISVELCEDDLTDENYFNKVYTEAAELFAYLCGLYGLTEQDILGHYEGYQRGIASNHSDPGNWLPSHGKSMDSFRADVKSIIEQQGEKEMTQDTFNIMMNKWLDDNDPLYKTLDDVPSYWKADAEALVKAGAIKGDGVYSFGVHQSVLKAAIINKRYTDNLLKDHKLST